MRFILATLLTALLSFLAGLYFPWWSVAIIAFLVAVVMRQFVGRSFLSGFLGIFLLWTVVALWIDTKNEHILSQKIAQVFPLGGSSVLLILITAFIGALVAGFAAMSGASVLPNKRRLR